MLLRCEAQVDGVLLEQGYSYCYVLLPAVEAHVLRELIGVAAVLVGDMCKGSRARAM